MSCNDTCRIELLSREVGVAQLISGVAEKNLVNTKSKHFDNCTCSK